MTFCHACLTDTTENVGLLHNAHACTYSVGRPFSWPPCRLQPSLKSSTVSNGMTRLIISWGCPSHDDPFCRDDDDDCNINTITLSHNETKRSDRRKHCDCALAVVGRTQKFSLRRRPPSQGRGMAKILSAADGHYLYLQTQLGEDRCTQFRVIVVTDPPTHPPWTGPITIHCAAKLRAQCN